jgi:hypothetical protein
MKLKIKSNEIENKIQFNPLKETTHVGHVHLSSLCISGFDPLNQLTLKIELILW